MSEQPYVNPSESIDANLELVKAMGADWYDPIPPDNYTCFQNPEFTLTSRGHRMLAEVRAWTIHGRKGGRTPHAAKDGRALKLPQLGALLGWDPSATIKVWEELEQHGLVRKDEKGWLWLCGRVNSLGRKKGENKPPALDIDQEWQKFCTDNFPDYLAKQFQQLSKSDRPALHQDIEAWNDFENQAKAQAMDAARKEVHTRRDQYFAERYRVKVRRFQRKADEEDKPKPLVQLSLLWTPELSVQNSGKNSVHTANGSLYNVPDEDVQTTPNKEDRVNRQSNSSSSQQKHPEGTTTTDEKAFLRRVRKELAPFGPLDQEILQDFIARCRAKSADCTADEIEHFIEVKAKLIPKDVQNRIAWLRTAVSKCFEPESLAEYRKRANVASRQPEHTPEELRDLKLRGLWASCDLYQDAGPNNVNIAGWLQQFQGALNDPDVTGELRERVIYCLNRKPAASEPGAKARKAGHV